MSASCRFRTSAGYFVSLRADRLTAQAAFRIFL